MLLHNLEKLREKTGCISDIFMLFVFFPLFPEIFENINKV